MDYIVAKKYTQESVFGVKENGNRLCITLTAEAKEVLEKELNIIFSGATLDVFKNKKIFLTNIRYNNQKEQFEEYFVYEIEGEQKEKMINEIDEMFKTSNLINCNHKVVVSSYESLIEYLK